MNAAHEYVKLALSNLSHRKMRSILTLVVAGLIGAFVLPFTAVAAQWEVPGDYATIQAAINDAAVVA